MLIKRVVGLCFITMSLLIGLIYIFSYKNLYYNTSVASYNDYNILNNIDYYGLIEIPELNIKNVIYNKTDPNNDVNKNVFLVNDNINLIVLASHSGSSPISYFNKLHLLQSTHQIILKINGQERHYEFFKKDLVKKTGKVNIEKYPYPVIVLITCSKSYNNYQELYYARLNFSSNYG